MTSDLPLHLRAVAVKLEQEGFQIFPDIDPDEDLGSFEGMDGDLIAEDYRGWQLCAVYYHYLYLEATHPDTTRLWVRCDESTDFQSICPWAEYEPGEEERLTQVCIEENLRQQLMALDSAKRLIDQALEESAKAAGQISLPGVLPCSD